jgi:hypothetical protein
MNEIKKLAGQYPPVIEEKLPSKTEYQLLIGDYYKYDFPSLYKALITVTTTPTDISLGAITIPSDIKGIINYATLDLFVNMIANTNASGDNFISGAQYIQAKVGGAAYSNAMAIPNGAFYVIGASSKQYAFLFKGIINIASLFNKGDTLDIKWALAKSQTNNLAFYNDVITLNIYTR